MSAGGDLGGLNRFAAGHAWAPYALLTLAMLLYGSFFVVGRAVYAEFPPVALSFWRSLISCLLLIPFVWAPLRKEYRVLRQHWKVVLALGVSQSVVGQTLMFWGLHTTTAINAALISSLLPAATVVLAVIMIGERVNRLQQLGIAVAFLGGVITIVRGDPNLLLDFQLVSGDMLALVATLSWAVYSVLVKRAPVGLNPFVLLFGLTAPGAVSLLPFYAIEGIVRGGYAMPSLAAIGGLIYLVVFAGIIALVLVNVGIARLGPSRAGAFFYLMPVFTALIAVLGLGEVLRFYHVAGLALVIGGIVFVGRTTDEPVSRSRSD